MIQREGSFFIQTIPQSGNFLMFYGIFGHLIVEII